MKKRTFLVLASTAMIGMVSAGSYAAWDNLSASTTGEVVVASRIDIKAGDSVTFANSRDGVTNAPVFTGDAIFDLSTVTDASAMNFELNVIVNDNGTALSSDAYKVSMTKNATPINETTGKFIDEAPGKTATETYKVVVTLQDNANGVALAGKTLDVDITGKLIAK